ncbi:MAG: molybdopterin-dependent oxidoreductase, partial [Actinomycetota bacterium]|nr:molybdopterin-dependent oxidoreductase [Actinomycetota bacterium]
MSILGNRVLRREDPKFLTSGGIYGDDLALDGALWATFVRSTVAHARIAEINADDARTLPGVVAVYTGADVDLPPVPAGVPGFPEIMGRSVLATDVVRFAGEAVAVVLTEERYQGEDAAEAVFVEYDPLPPVVDAASGATSETLLFPDHGSNVAIAFEQPLDEHFFDDCEVVVRQRIINQRLAPCPLEVRSGAATWGDDGRLTQWASNQAPHGAKADLASAYGVDPGQVRVIAPDVGGGFGAKIGLYAEDLVLPWLAKESGRTVRWTE